MKHICHLHLWAEEGLAESLEGGRLVKGITHTDTYLLYFHLTVYSDLANNVKGKKRFV